MKHIKRFLTGFVVMVVCGGLAVSVFGILLFLSVHLGIYLGGISFFKILVAIIIISFLLFVTYKLGHDVLDDHEKRKSRSLENSK